MATTSIYADLTITIDESLVITVTGEGSDTLTVHLPSLRDALSIWQRHREVFKPILKNPPTQMLPITIRFVVDDETVIAEWGANADPGIFERLIGVYPLDINVWRSIRKLLRR